MTARGPIHAMLPPVDSPAESEAREAELDRRLDAYRAEVRAETLAEAADEAEQTARAFSIETDWGSSAVGALRGLAVRLQRMAKGLDSRPVAADPDFFQAGHTYSYGPWLWRCDAVTTHPDGGERSALGWIRISDGTWTPYAYTGRAWSTDWTDVTEGGVR